MPGKRRNAAGHRSVSRALSPDDREASSDFKRRQSQTDELEFIESLNENGKTVYERVLALGKQSGMRIQMGHGKGFSLNAVSSGAFIAVCYGYPPSAYNQSIYTSFPSVLTEVKRPT